MRISANQPVVPDKFTMTEPPSLSLFYALRFLLRFQALMRPDRVAPSVSPRFLLSRGHLFSLSLSLYSLFPHPLRVIIKRFSILRIVQSGTSWKFGKGKGKTRSDFFQCQFALLYIEVRTNVARCVVIINTWLIYIVEEIMLHWIKFKNGDYI